MHSGWQREVKGTWEIGRNRVEVRTKFGYQIYCAIKSSHWISPLQQQILKNNLEAKYEHVEKLVAPLGGQRSEGNLSSGVVLTFFPTELSMCWLHAEASQYLNSQAGLHLPCLGKSQPVFSLLTDSGLLFWNPDLLCFICFFPKVFCIGFRFLIVK